MRRYLLSATSGRSLLMVLCVLFAGALFAQPANDDCADAIALVPGADALTDQTTVGAVAEDANPGDCSSDYGVWYTLAGTGNEMVITSENNSFDHEISVFTSAAGCDGPFTEVVCRDVSLGTESTAIDSEDGTTYYIYISYFGPAGDDTDTGTFDISVTENIPPANDTCDDAIEIDAGVSVDGTTVGASSNSVAFCGTSEGSGGTVWYFFTPPANGSLTLDMCGSDDVDAKVQAFTGACDDLVCITGEDDDCGNDPMITFDVLEGETVRIAVSGFSTAGEFTLNSEYIECTVNFACETELEIELGEDGVESIDSAAVIADDANFCVGDLISLSTTDFACDDADDVQVVTVTYTPGSGAEAQTCAVNVTVIADRLVGACADVLEVNLASITEVNLTLNDECQGLLIPEMVLRGDFDVDGDGETPGAELFDIVVMDNNPNNGPIVDGCGRFTYTIDGKDEVEVTEPVVGLTQYFNSVDEDIFIGGFVNSDDTPFSGFFASGTPGTASDAIVLATDGTEFGGTSITVLDMGFFAPGKVTFDYAFMNAVNNLDIAVALVDFEGVPLNALDLDEELFVSDPGMNIMGEVSLDVLPGYVLRMAIIDAGDFDAGGTFSELIVDNFVFDPVDIVNPLIGFTTQWGFINAEDKTPPAIVREVEDIELLCVDFENDQNNVSTLPASVDKCYLVNASTGATIPGSMAPALRARLLAGGISPLVPIFTDGCTSQIEVCVSDAVVFGDDPQCDDIVLTRTFTATEVAVCPSADGGENPSVAASFEITFVRPTLDDLDGDNIEEVVNYDQCGAANPTRADYPAPRAGDFPFLEVAGRTFPLRDGQSVCNIGVTFSDGDPIVTCPFTYKFVRTYTVIDWCQPDDVRTFSQVVKVGDTEAPVFTGPTAPINDDGDLVFGTNAGNVCAAFLRLDAVSAVDNCSGTNVTISAEIYPNRDLSGSPIGAFNVVPGGTPELSSAIPAGRHILRYTYTDQCGNTGSEDFDFVVEDQTPPVAICEDGLNISIAGGAVLTPDNIDAGSYDDCSGITRAIARVNANNLAVGGYRDEITLTCADLGMVRVGLRVTDALGNENFCWLDVLVEDKLAPTCVAPGDVVITCEEYNTTLPADIMDASNETLDALFGAAAGVDNCGTTSFLLTMLDSPTPMPVRSASV